MNYCRWEENIQLKYQLSSSLLTFTSLYTDHLEMWHQFRVIRKGQWKGKAFSRTHYNTSLRASCQCRSISNTVHEFQRTASWNGDSKHLQESYDIEVLPLLPTCFPYCNLISHSLEKRYVYVDQVSVVTQYIPCKVSLLRAHFSK